MISLYFLFIAIITTIFLVDITLDLLNMSHRGKDIPQQLSDVYSPEKYYLQQQYEVDNARFALFHKSLMFAVLLVFFIAGGFGRLHQWLSGFFLNPLITALVYFAIIGLASGIISLPFSIWNTFVIEEKYGFNKSTVKLFIIDLIKSSLITLIIGGGLLTLLACLFYRTGDWFWILGLAVMVVFSLLANALYSRVIVPLFNKQEPLEDGALLEAIKKFGNLAGFPVDKVYVIDGSKRSTKANAYFAGYGKNRRVVLYDTLIEKMSEPEIVAVLAHEIGHYRKGHIWINMFTGILQAAIFLYLFSVLSASTEVLLALGYSGNEHPVFHLALIGFALLFSPAERILGLLTHGMSRMMEYRADAFASSHDMGEELITGLKKLTAENLSNLTPHPLYVFVNYSHPTLLQRINRIKGIDKKCGG
ncbi:MAG TPA: M48 family metallopeptidase [Tenuifilaceae bacterium]|jgi:STE24 endopeptidase|nr:M48 family metallopeptidase [Bacteroidales bacterium]MDI9515763.1 M48 family metallopeptidase [Bacteroidota bacterium]NLH57432.1 M48 family metallopeptidase [Rikenellaceae bacterium]OQC62165.1 MAG: heat shock protein HtpX [Bacteroidetes bacterium ADurb.Bin008]HNV81043.1 M48 family metallopeptidase [Tenuifilaceae bacterium]